MVTFLSPTDGHLFLSRMLRIIRIVVGYFFPHGFYGLYGL